MVFCDGATFLSPFFQDLRTGGPLFQTFFESNDHSNDLFFLGFFLLFSATRSEGDFFFLVFLAARPGLLSLFFPLPTGLIALRFTRNEASFSSLLPGMQTVPLCSPPPPPSSSK